MTRRIIALSALCLLYVCAANSQGKIALKTNLLYGIGTFAPNIGAEIGLSDRSTLDVWGGINAWNLDGTESKNKKLAHWLIQPEYRYWFCERFNGHFIGGHGFFGLYNISSHKIPILFGSDSQKYRFKGNVYGVGISYGYQWMIAPHFNIEFTAGVGYARLEYDQFDCPRCGVKRYTDKTKNYFGPTKAGITLVYLIK